MQVCHSDKKVTFGFTTDSLAFKPRNKNVKEKQEVEKNLRILVEITKKPPNSGILKSIQAPTRNIKKNPDIPF